jgi:release factor glutamine methyltransferase
MRRLIKRIVGSTWKPFVTWYLRKPRVFRYRDISVTVQPGVFHPGFFFSTKLLLGFLEELIPGNGMRLRAGEHCGGEERRGGDDRRHLAGSGCLYERER